MSRPIPCDACLALGCSCDGIAHTCPTCGHVCTMHPSKETHHASEEDRRRQSELRHPSQLHGEEFDRIVAQLGGGPSLLEGDEFDRIVAQVARTEADPCSRPEPRGVPRRARRMEVREVEPYYDRAGVHPLERLVLVASTMTFAAWCTWWLWSHGR